MALSPGSDEHRRYYAQFARLAYQQPAFIDGNVPTGWQRDTALSNRNRHVFVNAADRQVVLALRGTQPASSHARGDLGTDLLLALNMRDFSARFRNSLRTAKQVRAKYAEHELTAVGHSLGASQAMFLHNRLGGSNAVKAVTYAAHTPTSDIQRQAISSLLGDKQRQRNLTNYVIPHDPIAAGTFLAGRSYTVRQTSKSPHDLGNYLA